MRSTDNQVETRRGKRGGAPPIPRARDRKVLMIADAAPPAGGPDGPGSTEFVKHLPRFGWLPTVWTEDDVEELARDSSRGRPDQMRDEWPSETAAVPRITGSGVLAMRRSLRGFVNARAGEGLTAVASRFAKASDERLEARPSANPHPDDGILSTRRIDALARKIRSERFDAIYSTTSNGSNHRLALELKRRTNLPWVADFRDSWTDDSRNRQPYVAQQPSAGIHSGGPPFGGEPLRPEPLCHATHRPWEQEILEAADVILTGSERQRQMLADRVPSQPDKVITIIHGRGAADSAGSESYGGIEITRQLAAIFDRLANRAAEAVDDSFAACRP